jgi:hypothetical protein
MYGNLPWLQILPCRLRRAGANYDNRSAGIQTQFAALAWPNAEQQDDACELPALALSRRRSAKLFCHEAFA